MPAASLAHLFHRLPKREHFGMLMGNLETAIFPCKDFDKTRGFVSIAPSQGHTRLFVDQSEFLQRGPMTLEQADKIALAPSLHAISAHDDLRI